MAGQDATVAAVHAVLARLCKRAGLSPERLRSTEIDARPLVELYVVRRHAQVTGVSPIDAVVPVVRDLARQLPPRERLIADAGLSLGLLGDDPPTGVDLDQLYAADLGARRTYLSTIWPLLDTLDDSRPAAAAPTPRQLRGRLEAETLTLLARRLIAASGYASATLPQLPSPSTGPRAGTVTVIGDAVLDNICSITGEFPTPDTPATGTFLDRPGGKGLNRAVAAARLGLHVRLIAAVGDDARGQRILDHLRAEGIDTDLVRVVHDAPTPVTIVLVGSTGEPLHIACPSDRVRLTVDDLDTPAAQYALVHSDAVVLTFEPPAPVIEHALNVVSRERHPPLLVQPVPGANGPQRFYRYFGAVDYLIGTRRELADLAPMAEPPAPTPDGDAELARRLRVLGATTVCMVEQFATSVRSDDLELDVGPFPVALKNSPGAPAAFLAALTQRLVSTGQRAGADDFVWATAAMAATQSLGDISGAMPTSTEIDRMVQLAGPTVPRRTGRSDTGSP